MNINDSGQVLDLHVYDAPPHFVVIVTTMDESPWLAPPLVWLCFRATVGVVPKVKVTSIAPHR